MSPNVGSLVRYARCPQCRSNSIPAILSPCLRKAKLLPWLYLKGLSSGDFQEAPALLAGPNAAGLPSSTITRLKAGWWEEYER